MNPSRNQEAALLGMLFAARGEGVTRTDLARGAGFSPEAVEPALAAYREAGYPIEFHPQGGILLREPPDIWCAEEILGRCPARKNLPAWEPLLLAETRLDQ